MNKASYGIWILEIKKWGNWGLVQSDQGDLLMSVSVDVPWDQPLGKASVKKW